jgi:HSP20 family molecular chaperone IbpA
MPLPDSLRTDKAEATFENGVVTLPIPKAAETRPRQIKITPREATEGRK